MDTFLYKSIFIPEGAEPPNRDIINLPELQGYINDFGNREGDIAFVAEMNGDALYVYW